MHLRLPVVHLAVVENSIQKYHLFHHNDELSNINACFPVSSLVHESTLFDGLPYLSTKGRRLMSMCLNTSLSSVKCMGLLRSWRDNKVVWERKRELLMSTFPFSFAFSFHFMYHANQSFGLFFYFLETSNMWHISQV